MMRGEVEPGIRYGHLGSGPGFNAACFRFPALDLTACVLLQSDGEDSAHEHLLTLAQNATK